MDGIGVPEMEPLTGNLHPQDEEGKSEEQAEAAPDELGAETMGEWGLGSSQYHWDDDEGEEEMDNQTITYRSNMI